MPDPERRLAAILSADAVGYSRLMAEDEAGTICTLGAYREEIAGLVRHHRGRVVDAPGDNVLAELPSALDAVACGVEIQRILQVRNAGLREERRMAFRIGIHLGDVAVEGERIYGDGVNIAARLEGLAEPGGLCVSRSVYDLVHGKLALGFEDLGERDFKNIPDPVRAYRIDLEPSQQPASPKRRPGFRHWAAGAGALVLLVGVAVAMWRYLEPAPGRLSVDVTSTPSVAVLRFDNLGQDPANEAFTDGIHHDILTQLSKIGALKVIARTSIKQLDPNLSVAEIGSRLGVATVLEGGIQRAGGRVRVNVQLIDCATQGHLWAETYDRELTAASIFGIQSEIATSVASALRATLSAEEEETIATMPTENLAAYQAYLLGKQRLANASSDSLVEAGEHFQRAIELDPSFALAHVGLATFYLGQVYVSGLPADELLAQAQAATDRALQLDDRLGEAYASLGEIRSNRFDPEGAEAAFKRALELNPNYATAYSWYGYLLCHILGRPEEALAVHRKAIELDPLSAEIISLLGTDLSALGRSDEALAWWTEALEADPSLPIYDVVGDHYWMALGQLDQAVSWYVKAIDLDPGNSSLLAMLGWLFLDLGAPDEAGHWIERSIELGPDNPWVSYCSALLHLYQDRDEEAALDDARRSLAHFPGNQTAHWLLRNRALRAGRYSEARALYENFLPELLEDDEPRIASFWRYVTAIDLALVLTKTGERERADLLLERSLQHIRTVPRLSFSGHWVADVQIYALQGKKRRALAALQQAVDEGWRAKWWYYLQREPNLESLHAEPEFQAMVAEVEADMAAQLARVREMQRRGELPLALEAVSGAE